MGTKRKGSRQSTAYTPVLVIDRKRRGWKNDTRVDYAVRNRLEDDLNSVSLQAIRLMISTFYLHSAHESDPTWWEGPHGTIRHIITRLGLKENDDRLVHRVIVQTNICVVDKVGYTGKSIWEKG